MSTQIVTNPGPRSLRGGAKHAEARPWDEENSPGDPNRGSYAFSAAVGMVELAHDLLAQQQDHTQPPTLAKTAYLARVLLRCADATQAAVRGDGWVDRQASSHTRARGAVRSACEVLPPPIGASEPERIAWEVELTQRAVDLLRIAATLDDDGPDLRASAWVRARAEALSTDSEAEGEAAVAAEPASEAAGDPF